MNDRIKSSVRDSEVVEEEIEVMRHEIATAESSSEAIVKELQSQSNEESNLAATLAEIKEKKEEEACHLREVVERLVANRRSCIKVSTNRVNRFEESMGRLGQLVSTFDGKLEAANRTSNVLINQRPLELKESVLLSTGNKDQLESEVK